GAPGPQSRGAPDAGVRGHALVSGARRTRESDGGGSAVQVVHSRHESGGRAQFDRASRQRGRAAIADAAGSGARVDRAGARRRSDRRSRPGAGLRPSGPSVARNGAELEPSRNLATSVSAGRTRTSTSQLSPQASAAAAASDRPGARTRPEVTWRSPRNS